MNVSDYKASLNRDLPQTLPLYLSLFPILVIFFIQLFYVIVTPRWSLATLCLLGAASAIYGIWLAFRWGPFPFNFVAVYGVYLVLSHLGLVVTDTFIPGTLESFALRAGLSMAFFDSWYFTDARLYATGLSGLGISAYILGAGFIGRFGRTGKRANDPILLDSRTDRPILVTGVILLIFSSSYILIAGFSGNLPLFNSYAEFFAASSLAPGYSFFLVALSIGLTFLLATGTKRDIYRWIWFFIIPAGILLIAGSRGGVLYVLAASVSIVSKKGFRFGRKEITAILVIFFLLIPLIRSIRSKPLSEVDLSQVMISVTDPFMELGFQIRPLIITIGWIDGGEDFAYGGTYWLPIQRLLGLVVPFLERPTIEGNRLDVQGRTPGQGYTVVGEAYFNFGHWGVICILAAIGYFMARANRSRSLRSLAFFGAVAAILINSQRNSFIFVPGQVVIVIALLILAHLLSKPSSSTAEE
ncbi:MAG: O-antigen polysaccharide polymerase Wzy family protein [Anaerolineae bacterium]|nr:O-antigen polysaccharide polymerase Wzy family protein [Anaerolineae bacterium]